MALDPVAPMVRDALGQLGAPSETQVKAWTEDIPVPSPADGAATRSTGWLSLVAGIAIGAVAVGGAAWMMQAPAPDWRTAVAEYQALYSTETIASLSFSDAELQQQLAEAEARISAKDLYDTVADLPPLQLLRSQILAHDGAPLVQIVFATEAGEPVALCLMERAAGDTAEIEAVMARKGLSSLAFDTDSHTWLLIGTQDDALISAVGKTLGARLGIDI